jgi:hypothetical protein
MKRTLFLFLGSVIILFSCNQDDKNPEFNILGYWNLVEITPSFSLSDLGGNELDFEEKYIFNNDGTFIKFSTKMKGVGEVLEIPAQALGQFQINPSASSQENVIYEIELVFETNQEMAANCGEGNSEFLFVTKEYKLINNTWSSCDGPGFIYTKN